MRNYVNETGTRAKKRQKKYGRVNVLAILISVSMICSLMVPYAQFIEASSDLPNCGKVEHRHDASCYRLDNTPSCGKAEGEDHTHTDACYDKVLACVKEEHTHMDACYSDRNADVEDPAMWDAQFGTAALTKDTWAESLAAVAEKQVGYEESEDNYEVEKDGSHNGYTRYGDFADDTYGSWDTSFVNFCLEYAGIAEANVFPKEETDAEKWQKEFVKDEKENKTYIADTNKEDYTPQVGDIVFIEGNKENGNDKDDTTMGIVTDVNKKKDEITVVEGDSHDQVEENTYDADDKHITDAIQMDQVENAVKEEEAAGSESAAGSDEQAAADTAQPEGDKGTEAADPSIEDTDKAEADKEEGSDAITTEDPTEPTSVYICGKEEHKHGDACYDEQGELTCKQEEHQHGLDCLRPAEGEEQPSEEPSEEQQPEEQPSEEPAQPDEEEGAAPESGYICGKEEHTHTADCYDDGTYNLSKPLLKLITNREGEPELICGKEEHQHDESCLPEGEEAPQPIKELTPVDVDGTTITLSGPASSFEEGKDYSLKAEVVTDKETLKVVDKAVKGAAEEMKQKVNSYQVFDITLLADGEPTQPLGPVEVKFSGREITNSVNGRDTEAKVLHVNEAAGTAQDMKASDEGNSLLVETSQFSPYVVADFDEPTYYCGYESNHKHDDSCYDENGQIVCGQHEHTDSCLEEQQEKDTETIPIVKTFTQKVGAFNITFDIKGTAEVAADGTEAGSADETATEDATAGSDESAVPEEEIAAEEDDNADVAPVSDVKGTAKAGIREVLDNVAATVEESKEAAEADTTSGEDTADVEEDSALETGEEEEPAADSGEATTEDEGTSGLNVEATLIDESSTIYKSFEKYAKENSEGAKQLLMQVLQLDATYNGEEIDLGDCEVTATIAADGSLKDYVSNAGDGVDQDIVISVLGAAEDAQISNLGSTTVQKEELSESKVELMSVSAPARSVRVMALSGNPLANPEFTVQYYANLELVAKTGTNALPVIDTSGKKLPVNGKGTSASPNDNAIKNIYVDGSGNVQTAKTLTEVYSQQQCNYHEYPSLKYFDKLVENNNYNLKEIWKLKAGKKATSTERGDWDIYDYVKHKDVLHFTNNSARASSGAVGSDPYYILIDDESTIRLVYEPSTAKPDIKASFYDYDISSGRMYQNVNNAINNSSSGITKTGSQRNDTLYYVYTKEAGINSAGNYSGSGTKLAFGNVNTGTTLGENLWGGNLLNKYNGTQGGHPTVTGAYKGCTFGLVTGLDNNGKIQYASGVRAPKLFNEGDATGKTSYDNDEYSLKFNRSGDTHTLTAVNGTGATGLESFGHPSPNSTTTHTHIWTNDFWPMDSARSYGTDGHDLKFGSYQYREKRAYAGSSTTGEPGSTSASRKDFPYSDDGKDHNSYFGMKYDVEFELKADYVGPLEYYFFGDDDMWVFLDGKLVCDIGGVHSSVGEYVNLWDYLAKGSAGKHTLSFYYTERGASGSTCWMQFTLPSVSTLTPEKADKDTGELKVEKKVQKITEEGETIDFDECTDNFNFTLYLNTKDGEELPDNYNYTVYDKDGKPIKTNLIISDGNEFQLKHGQYIVVKYLPSGTRYKVVEDAGTITDGNVKYFYGTNISGDISHSVNADGIWENVRNENGITISADDENGKREAESVIEKDKQRDVLYTNFFTYYKLPSTGGMGIYWYIISGILLMAGAALIVYKNRCREVLKR